MNDVCSRVIREFSEFLDDTNKKSPVITASIAYEITIIAIFNNTASSALTFEKK